MIINNLHQLVEEQTKKTPHAIALLYIREMIYAKLNMPANQILYYLCFKTPGNKKPLGIYIKCGLALFIAILAILKNKFLIVNHRNDKSCEINKG